MMFHVRTRQAAERPNRLLQEGQIALRLWTLKPDLSLSERFHVKERIVLHLE
jgi:hypothetical protein